MDGPLSSSRQHSNRHYNDNNNNRHHPDDRYHRQHKQHHQNRNSRESRERSRSRDRFTKGRNNHSIATVTTNRIDRDLPQLNDDPRSSDPSKRISNKALSQSKGRNTESFHAASTFVRPDLRVQIGSSRSDKYKKVLKHDDVVIVPEMFGAEDDWSIYYTLVKEMREIQEKEKNEGSSEHAHGQNENKNNGDSHNKGRNNRHNSKSEWIPWHEGAHLISKKPDESSTYQSIVKRLCEYFDIDTNKPVGTRFNWYKDSNDWKPFHHDSAAFNPSRAKNQNITIGASFGCMRELAFIRTKTYASDSNSHHSLGWSDKNDDASDNKCKLYFPQNNNGVFSFGRDANIHWKHGINALPPAEHDGKGRISIILWGYARNIVEEDGSPPLLGSDGYGPHAVGGGRNNSRRGPRHRRMDDRRDQNGGFRHDHRERHDFRDRHNGGERHWMGNERHHDQR